MTRTPVLILGDAPNLRSGLARIAKDLTQHLWWDTEALNISVAQLGLGYDGEPQPWPVYPVLDVENWGEGDLERVWEWHAKGEPGILFTVWDPARCGGTAHLDVPGLDRWGYFAIDSANINDKIGGPALAALCMYRKVLAYSDFGAKVLRRSLLKVGPVPWLPHGFWPERFEPNEIRAHIVDAFNLWMRQSCDITIGCVATNQPRKDLSLFFATAETQPEARIWLHTDKMIGHWSIPELADIHGRNDARALITTEPLTDSELGMLYMACDYTVAPGRGEGFGYPIVESLACGTPVVHFNYAGGAELVPHPDWLLPDSGFFVEGPYALKRPWVHPSAVRWFYQDNVLAFARDPRCSAYCRGSVAHLAWPHLWPRWREWFRRGLKEFRARGSNV